jgi:mannose-1-phosphate guanylyltransferase/phosphomannomutase
VKAVIMAGGFGTRLRPLTNNIPKPMIPMVNKPMMEHIVDLLRQHEITDLVTCCTSNPS